ncbi:MAG: dihydroorotase [Ruminococcaceae bacterium]|nr:dihydroorotase [Oscillospiraceae bacterium]
MRLLIKNGRVLDPSNGLDEIMDIYMENSEIVQIEKDIDLSGVDIEIIDATGLTVAPGLVDMHCHLREPGYEYKEDIESGTKSAAMGGFTSIACMPNTNPVIDNGAMVSYIINKAREVGAVNVYPIGTITKGLKGEELAEIGEMKFAGVVAVSDDGRPVESPAIMRNALKYAAMFDTPVISHCEELSLVQGGALNEGYMSTYMGLKGISRASEELMVSREAILSLTYQVPVHIAHVSTRNSVEIIRHAKAQGAPITCETCPHYFTLTEEAAGEFDTNAKMNPPLRTADDVQAIIEGLKDGTIDAIATDHAPHHPDEKNVEFAKAANGIVGFETALSLGVTYLVKAGHLTMAQLIEKMSVNPAQILGLNKGQIKVGKNADLVIIDENKKRTVETDKFLSKSKNSPYNGYELSGTVEYTIVNGHLVVRQGILL